jgi:hypothetical protein
MIRNCANQFSKPRMNDKVQLPFLVCALDKRTHYNVMVSENRLSAVINSECVPSLYNDNHVLSNLNLCNE